MASNDPSNAELTQQITALTTIVTNSANAIAINQAPPAAAAPLPTTIAFATAPGMAATKELIDYTMHHGSSLYRQVTKALGTPYNMEAVQEEILKNQL